MKLRELIKVDVRYSCACDARWLRACRYPNKIVRLMIIARYGWSNFTSWAYKQLGKKYQYHFNNW